MLIRQNSCTSTFLGLDWSPFLGLDVMSLIDKWNEFRFARALERVRSVPERVERQRVLHISNVFSAPSETFTYDLISELERRKRTTNLVACFQRRLKTERPYPALCVLYGSKRQDLILGTGRATQQVHRLLEDAKPDVVHGHFGWVGLPTWRAVRKVNAAIPIVVSMHGSDVNEWPRTHPWYADALREAGADPRVLFVTHTETYARRLLALGVSWERMRVIPNTVSRAFQLVPRNGSTTGGTSRILAVGRLTWWKGHDTLLHAIDLARQNSKLPLALTIVGHGPELGALKGLTRELKLTSVVRFTGRVPHQHIPRLMREHHLYVQPSRKDPNTHQEEGQPVALLEALASGLKVVVTDTGAMRETVWPEGPTSLAAVVPPEDPATMASALVQLCSPVQGESPEAEQGKSPEAERLNLLRRHDLSKHVASIESTYEESKTW